MTKPLSLCLLVAMLALGVAGCATAQTKEPHAMLIDTIPQSLWQPQTTLTEDHTKEQQSLIDSIGPLLNGKFRIVASRGFELLPSDGISPNPAIFKMWFHDTMDGSLHLSLDFENYPDEQPFVSVWKTRSNHPEYAALAMMTLPNHGALLGYFELEPK